MQKGAQIRIPIWKNQTLIKLQSKVDVKKKEKEAYATDDPTDTSAKEQEDMAKEAIKKFKSL